MYCIRFKSVTDEWEILIVFNGKYGNEWRLESRWRGQTPKLYKTLKGAQRAAAKIRAVEVAIWNPETRKSEPLPRDEDARC